MKRRGSGLIALVVLAMMLLANSALAQSRQAVVTAKSATVYESPKTSSRTLGTLGKGAQVTVTKVKGKIAQIKYAGGSGYVKKSALKLERRSVRPPPPRCPPRKRQRARRLLRP